MTLTQQRERVRLGGLIERVKPGTRLSVNGLEYDHKFIASTELLASDRGVIYVDAWDWKRYMKRPRFIAMHDLGAWSGKITEVSLGRGVYVNVETGLDPGRVGESGKALIVYTRYASTPFAQEVKRLYDEGGLDDVSVRWDWRTEVVRNPYEEEAQKYGEELAWVCTHAELVELSAVLLGADSGAQVLRSEVVEAFERCRSQKIALPMIERLIRELKPLLIAVDRPVPREVTAALDTAAADDAIDLLQTGTQELQEVYAALAAPRQTIGDGLTLAANLVAAAEPTIGEGEEEPPESSLDLAVGDLVRAVTAWDSAYQAMGKATVALASAVTAVSAAAGGATVPASDRVLIDLEAVLADSQQPDSPTFRRLYEAYKALDA